MSPSSERPKSAPLTKTSPNSRRKIRILLGLMSLCTLFGSGEWRYSRALDVCTLIYQHGASLSAH
jgi:hypothetical protein